MGVIAQLHGNLSHALPRRRTHPPFHISFTHYAETRPCRTPSSLLVVGRSRAREASSFLAEGAGEAGRRKSTYSLIGKWDTRVTVEF